MFFLNLVSCLLLKLSFMSLTSKILTGRWWDWSRRDAAGIEMYGYCSPIVTCYCTFGLTCCFLREHVVILTGGDEEELMMQSWSHTQIRIDYKHFVNKV